MFLGLVLRLELCYNVVLSFLEVLDLVEGLSGYLILVLGVLDRGVDFFPYIIKMLNLYNEIRNY